LVNNQNISGYWKAENKYYESIGLSKDELLSSFTEETERKLILSMSEDALVTLLNYCYMVKYGVYEELKMIVKKTQKYLKGVFSENITKLVPSVLKKI